MFAAAAAFALVGVAPLSISAWMGVDPAIPGLDAAKSFMAMMSDRSPGDRTAAELTKTKKKAPQQRALAKIAKPETPPAFEEAIAPPAPVLAELPPFKPTLAGLGPLLQSPPIGGGEIPPGQSNPPGGGGGTPPGGPPVNPPETPPPAVVPEPGTWAMMLLGFGFVGWSMRRRRTNMAASRA